MPVTLTIKNVPDAVAEGLRRRAQAHRRSLQQELLLVAESAALTDTRVGEPAPAPYGATKRRAQKKAPTASSSGGAARLTLDQLWERARDLGASMPAESTQIVRSDRDARRGR